mmetsp:Transcript_2704/g.9293  ORF Transcript_2704/g.9293 Transcript_2704/m.9293 type:complete len:404 (-) Transcript_2704:885-2096(-)
MKSYSPRPPVLPVSCVHFGAKAGQTCHFPPRACDRLDSSRAVLRTSARFLARHGGPGNALVGGREPVPSEGSRGEGAGGTAEQARGRAGARGQAALGLGSGVLRVRPGVFRVPLREGVGSGRRRGHDPIVLRGGRRHWDARGGHEGHLEAAGEEEGRLPSPKAGRLCDVRGRRHPAGRRDRQGHPEGPQGHRDRRPEQGVALARRNPPSVPESVFYMIAKQRKRVSPSVSQELVSQVGDLIGEGPVLVLRNVLQHQQPPPLRLRHGPVRDEVTPVHLPLALPLVPAGQASQHHRVLARAPLPRVDHGRAKLRVPLAHALVAGPAKAVILGQPLPWDVVPLAPVLHADLRSRPVFQEFLDHGFQGLLLLLGPPLALLLHGGDLVVVLPARLLWPPHDLGYLLPP